MTRPVVTSIAPATGPSVGGTIVTITGTGLTEAVAVRFGGYEASNIAVASDTQVIAVSPAGAGAQDVTVTTPDGRSAASVASQFCYGTLHPADPGSSYSVDPVLTSTIVGSLVSILSTAADPEALEAQGLLMRRLAQEGGGAQPACGAVADIGGYLTLMAQLKARAMRDRTLAAILGSGASSLAHGGWADTPLSMTAIANDPAQGRHRADLPAEVWVRSDFVSFVQAAQKTAHAYGASLPLTGPSAIALPPGGPGAAMPQDVLYYLGRTLSLAPQAALQDPAADPLALVRPAGEAGAFAVAARVLAPGNIPVAPADYVALAGDGPARGIVRLSGARLVPLRPLLAAAGFHPTHPADTTADRWASFANVAGLVVGDTMLGDELELLYPPDEIASSVFAPLLNTVWNGRTFV